MGRPVSIEVRGVSKSFRIPGRHATDRRRRRIRSPLRAGRGRELKALDDVSFEVHKGEFFGIVGRNGSGKSTLLKLLASIYRTDAGSIRIAGRLAPFLELGVGFNAQLPAYDNVMLNGVMMGLTRQEAEARYEEIVEFAGLSEYTDLQLKNYSSGMKVRLGFSVMTHVDADVLLIDEVLGVGDAEFQEKCQHTFDRMRKENRTIVLVTHDMATVSIYCERAMLLHEGVIDQLGDPAVVANRYMELNLQATMGDDASDVPGFAERYASALADPPIRIVDSWLADHDGRRRDVVAQREPIVLHAVLEADRATEEPGFRLRIDNQQGGTVFLGDPLRLAPGHAQAGERFHVTATIDNRLGGGRYVLIAATTRRGPDRPAEPAGPAATLSFEVEGDRGAGIVALDHELAVERESDEEIARL